MRFTVREIQDRVARFYGLPVIEMVSARRARRVARPRQVAMYLSRDLTPQSLPEIGRRFGNRDHTTVMHAIKTIDALRLLDPDLDDDVKRLSKALLDTDPHKEAIRRSVESYAEAFA